MPLIHGKSPKSFVKNLKTEINSGKPKPQALAIAYSVKRAAQKKKMAKGGEVENLKENFAKEEMDEAQGSPKQMKMEMKQHPDMANKMKEIKKKKMADGGVVVDGDPYKEGEHIPDTEYHMNTKKQEYDDIDHPKDHEAEAAHVSLEIERAEHPDVAGMVMKIMQNKADQMKMAKGGIVEKLLHDSSYADGGTVGDSDQYKKDMSKMQEGADNPYNKDTDYEAKFKNFMGLGDDNKKPSYAGEYNEGGEIPEPSRSHHPEYGFVDSDRHDDDFVSEDDYMNEYMDHEEDTPEIKKKKMLSGILADIAKENYGRNK